MKFEITTFYKQTFILILYLLFICNTLLNKISYQIIKMINIYNNSFIFSFYYDSRFNSIRLLALKQSKFNYINIFCTLHFLHKNRINCPIRISNIDTYSKNQYVPELEYCNFLVYLKGISHYLQYLDYITINDSLLYIPHNFFSLNTMDFNIILCLTTFNNIKDETKIIYIIKKAIKYKIKKIFLYYSSSSIDVLNTIKKYAIVGIIELLMMKSGNILEKAGYHGQIIKHNDCLYRNLYKYRFIIFTDLDEQIIPSYKYTSMLDMIYDIDKYKSDIYYFQQIIYYKESNINKYNYCFIENFYNKKYIINNPFIFKNINSLFFKWICKNKRKIC